MPVITTRTVPELHQVLHDNPLVHRILAARGVLAPSELDCSLAGLPTPDRLPDIEQAVTRLLQAREQSQRILIVGDYDCDGASSTAVAVLGLEMLGFQHLNWFIPDRFSLGYGLSPEIVTIAAERYQADLILTVDNGVASISGVQKAREYGIDVVVTDHHLPTDERPAACAIVNPNMPGSDFASSSLAGVGVMFYTLLAVRARLRERGDQYAKAPLQNLLDLVAIGTVADLVPLDTVNRVLVEQGLRRMRAGVTRPGVLALLDIAGRQHTRLTTQDIGFAVGPRLNAAGRLDDMSLGVSCLLSASAEQAAPLALQLDGLNRSRREIEQTMRNAAQQQLETLSLDPIQLQHTFSLCLMNEHWHEGVVGILAGRLKEQWHRPAVVFTGSGDAELKGSARSIPGVHVRDVLDTLHVQNPGMITRFGGHAMAAGLTLPRTQFEAFKAAFEHAVRVSQGGLQAEQTFVTDGSLSDAERSLEMAQLLTYLMPWGQGFEPPLFVDDFMVQSQRVVGQKHLQLTLRALNGGAALRAIAFNQPPLPDTRGAVHAVYALSVNEWRDQLSLQLRIEYLEPLTLR